MRLHLIVRVDLPKNKRLEYVMDALKEIGQAHPDRAEYWAELEVALVLRECAGEKQLTQLVEDLLVGDLPHAEFYSPTTGQLVVVGIGNDAKRLQDLRPAVAMAS